MHEGLENLYNYTDEIVSGSSSNLSEDSTIINIIHLVSSIDQGGIERLLLSMAPYWNLKRFNIEVWCLNTDNILEYLDIFKKNCIKVRIVGRLKRERIEWRVIWRLAKLANMHRVSIFHSHTPYPLFIGLLARFFIRKKIAHIHHQHSPPPKYQTIPMRSLCIFMPVNLLIAVSSSTAADVQQKIPNLSCPINIIPNGIEFHGVEEEWKPSPLHKVYTAARLTKQKNIEVLLLAIAKVKLFFPEVTLTILGDGELREQLQLKSRQLGIDNKVNFLGYVLNPTPFHQNLGIFVLPSLWEPFGLSLVEAMAHGKPCIATEVGGMREIIHNGKNGLLIPSNDIDALVNAICKIIDDAAFAEQLGREAKKRAHEFHVKKTVDLIQAAYENCLLDTC